MWSRDWAPIRPALPAPFDQGNFLNPTNITEVESSAQVCQEEIFGPVVTIVPFDDEEEAIQIANGVNSGLSAVVQTYYSGRAVRVSSQIDAGTVWVNDWFDRDLRVPFGGMRASGVGLEEITWRAASAEALERRVKVIEDSGLGAGWDEDGYAHGPAYRFTTPTGHPMKLLWELDYFEAPDDKRSKLRNRPQRRPLRGVPVRRIDHVNVLAGEVASNRRFMMDTLGFRLREQKIGEGGVEVEAWPSVSALVHEIGVMRDATGSKGRFHHLC